MRLLPASVTQTKPVGSTATPAARPDLFGRIPKVSPCAHELAVTREFNDAVAFGVGDENMLVRDPLR